LSFMGFAPAGGATAPTQSQRTLHVFRCADTRHSVNPQRAIN
jgi:hypothetical protein